jgi:hypothetical protein
MPLRMRSLDDKQLWHLESGLEPGQCVADAKGLGCSDPDGVASIRVEGGPDVPSVFAVR